MSKQQELDDLRKKMLADENLPLKRGATNLVFGVGDPEAKILFIGEGPGYWEDMKAEPFVGNAGALLNQLLQSIKLERKSVYITNVVHHRPPQNRDPLPEEIETYKPYLDKIIEIISPKIIVTLGRFSMGKFLPGVRITAVHGKGFEVNWKGLDLIVVPMFHPAAALRSSDVMRMIKEDFLKLPQILNKPVEKPKEDEKPESEQLKFV